jgi:hypothetical protein
MISVGVYTTIKNFYKKGRTLCHVITLSRRFFENAGLVHFAEEI